MVKKYFEDLVDGERVFCKPLEMTKERIISFAEEFDPHPFHTNGQLADKSMFGGLIASSLHTLSACTKVVVDAWWTNLKASETRPDFGFGTVKCHVTNQNNEIVVEYGYQYIIRIVSGQD